MPQRQFALDDDYLDDLKAEPIEARRVALDEDGRVLVWIMTCIGGGAIHAGPHTYTRPHRGENPHIPQRARR